MEKVGGESKGKATALGSLFPAEEAQKASKLVQDAILDRQFELRQLNSFIEDNSNLTKLVRKLPDEISHQVMVPFGSAAFFPGQLIHTNEFMVLLGDGYYAEQTSKQTVDILKRREKSLESQVEALKACLLDLEAEANFFDSTASDVKEGIVEIMEEYVEEPDQDDCLEMEENYAEESQNESSLEEEHARIMARLSELEKEELEDDSGNGSDQDDDLDSKPDTENSFCNDEDGSSGPAVSFFKPQNLSSNGNIRASKDTELMKPLQNLSSQESSQSSSTPIYDHNYSSNAGSKYMSKDGSTKSHLDAADVSFEPHLPSISKDKHPTFSDAKVESSSDNTSGFNGRKAFTGSVIEHTHGLQPSNLPERSTSSDQVQDDERQSLMLIFIGKHQYAYHPDTDKST